MAAVALLAHAEALADKPKLDDFSFTSLIEQAKALASKSYARPRETATDWLRNIGYDGYRDIRTPREKFIWAKPARNFQLDFFHIGSLYLSPVAMYEVGDGKAKPIPYDPSLFNFGRLTVPEGGVGPDLGYAGLRLHYPLNKSEVLDELAVFLGASYFRSLGQGQIYGLSARGLAVDTALAKGEEFPAFTALWVERPARRAKAITVWALLDSESVTGAYRFVITPGRDVKMEVSARLFTRQPVEKLGIAPLTSMYVFGENHNRMGNDFRPEVHDSDGLLISQNGEWLWRPLRNPKRLSVSSYGVKDLTGFGLLQRDRNFTSYQDLEAHYERRPSVWVEPKGDWGKGIVQLVEIPTDSEIHDNIVAYWIPEAKVEAGQSLSFDYRLTWGEGNVMKPPPLQVVGTHVGNQFGKDVFKFVIDFTGDFPNSAKQIPEAEVWVGRGAIVGQTIKRNPHIKGWRLAFDYQPDGGDDLVEMRALIKVRGKQVSETWSNQWSNN
jgi:glucans biosynthesis protein